MFTCLSRVRRLDFRVIVGRVSSVGVHDDQMCPLVVANRSQNVQCGFFNWKGAGDSVRGDRFFVYRISLGAKGS